MAIDAISAQFPIAGDPGLPELMARFRYPKRLQLALGCFLFGHGYDLMLRAGGNHHDLRIRLAIAKDMRLSRFGCLEDDEKHERPPF